ncbi:MAG: NACHT domain-containing protein [Hyphomicrobiaceae bacterium]|nr:NACHT domain-containing protein [Hyphomicrobiaceae bacterium]
MGRKENIAVKNDELLEGVIVMAAISADGRYLPFHPLENNPNLAAKIAAVENVPKRIHTVVIAKGQVQQEPEENSYTLIEAENFKDLINQLEDNGGVFGEELREQAREEREALWLPGRADPDIDWNSLYQIPRLRLIDMAKAARPSGPRSPDGRDQSDDEFIRSSIDGYEEVLGADKLPLDRELLAKEFLNGLLSTSSHQRGIILGPPGSGKSSFMGWLVRNMADTIPDNGSLRPFPILVRLAVWEAAWKDAGKKLPLDKWLIQLTGEWTKTKKKKRNTFLTGWLAQGRIVPLFDGLDEIGKDFFNYFARTIRQLGKDQQRFVISCRTVSEERYTALALPLYYIASLEQTARDAYIASFPWENDDRRKAVQAHLPNAHAIAALTTNPQLLSFLCHTTDRNPTLSLPLVRVELIGAMLRTLLEEKPVNIAEENQLTRRYTPAKLTSWLAAVAFRLFTSDDKRRMIFPAAELEKIVEEVVGQSNERVVQPFIDEMRQRGILRRHQNGWFFFHLILQEYLSAHELARLIESDGFDREMTFVSDTKPLGEWLYDRSLEPHWEQVMLLTAGSLKNPTAYLELIADDERDTLFRHHLSIAARMCGEVPLKHYEENNRLAVAVKQILDTTCKIWKRSSYDQAQRSISSLFEPTLPMLWHRPDNLFKPDLEFQKWQFNDKQLSWKKSSRAISRLRHDENTIHHITDKLISILSSKNKRDWSSVIGAVMVLEEVVPTSYRSSEVIEILKEYTRESDLANLARHSAIFALGVQAAASTRVNEVTEFFISAIYDLALGSPEKLDTWEVIPHFLAALNALAPTIPAHEKLVDSLISQFKEQETGEWPNDRQEITLLILGALGMSSAKIEKIATFLFDELRDSEADSTKNFALVRSLIWLGGSHSKAPEVADIIIGSILTASPEGPRIEEIQNDEAVEGEDRFVLDSLMDFNKSMDSWLPEYGAVTRLANAISDIEEFAMDLINVIIDSNETNDMRRSAAGLFVSIHHALPNFDVTIARLSKYMNSPESDNIGKHWTQEIIEVVSPEISDKEQMVDYFIKLMGKEIVHINREAAFQRLFSCGPTANRFEYVWPKLMNILDGEDKELRCELISWLGEFGIAANRPPITTFLEQLASSENQPKEVSDAATKALKKIRGE